MDIAKSKACNQSPFVIPFTKNTIGTIININFIRSILTLFIPFSKLVKFLVSVSVEAIVPKYVWFPVAITTPVALPLIMLVPNKQILSSSLTFKFSFLFFRTEYFSTGSDSPVKEDWLTNKSLLVIILISAGIISPAERYTISPGTISLISISLIPDSFLHTAAVVFINAFNFSAALFDLNSWKNFKKPLIVTIIETTITVIKLLSSGAANITSVIKDTPARTNKTNIKGLIKALISWMYHGIGFSCSTRFNPHFSLLFSTWFIVRPSTSVFNFL